MLTSQELNTVSHKRKQDCTVDRNLKDTQIMHYTVHACSVCLSLSKDKNMDIKYPGTTGLVDEF
jgi:hypothetical protein